MDDDAHLSADGKSSSMMHDFFWACEGFTCSPPAMCVYIYIYVFNTHTYIYIYIFSLVIYRSHFVFSGVCKYICIYIRILFIY